MRHAPSTDGVSVVIHELAGSAGHQVVLLAHATGFHGHAYQPVAKHLAPRFHTFGLDFRGHGDTALAPGGSVSWLGYGDDALAAAAAIAGEVDDAPGVIGFGHSMGGAALLMAAAARPALFRTLVLYEPIVYPTDRPRDPDPQNPLRDGARRRRPVFDSFEAAIANYASKPPMASFDPDVLDAYVRHGFRPEGEHIRLKCEPDTEADTFDQGGRHATWDLLGAIDVPVVVVGGRIDAPLQPAAVAEEIAARLPDGRYVLRADLDHFGPLIHPDQFADLIAATAAA